MGCCVVLGRVWFDEEEASTRQCVNVRESEVESARICPRRTGSAASPGEERSGAGEGKSRYSSAPGRR